jgi:hypothetical protein
MIEISEKSELTMSYADAVFYCFCLGAGWRLPSRDEYTKYIRANCWHAGDNHDSIRKWYVIPVRDLKDD